MKFIIGLLIGSLLVWGWFDKYGRLQRTDVVVETRTNVVTRINYETVFATQEIYRTVWQTNTVTVTNLVMKTVHVPETPQVNVMHVPDTPARTPSVTPQRQPAPARQPTVTTPSVPTRSSFRGARSLSPTYDKDGNKLVGHTKMDGSIEYTPRK